MSDAPVSTLPGLGPVTQERLVEAGIRTVGELRSIGPVEAYRRLKFMMPRQVSLNALYALEAALRGCHWLDLPQDVKTALRREATIIELSSKPTIQPSFILVERRVICGTRHHLLQVTSGKKIAISQGAPL